MTAAVHLDALHLVLAAAAVLIAGAGWALAVWSDRRARDHQEDAAETAGFRSLVERSHDPMLIVDHDGTITYVNPAAEATFGYRDRIGTSAIDLLHPDDQPAARDRMAEATEGAALGEPVVRRIRHADGRWRSCETVSTNLLADPDVGGVVVVLRDVTAWLAAESEAASAAELTRTILDTTTALVVSTTADGRLLSLNRAAERLTGYATNEVVGDHYSRFVPPDEWLDADRAVSAAAAGQGPTTHETHWTGRSGERRLVAWTNALVPAVDGRGSSVVSTGIDVTDARRAERSARSADQREHDRLAWEATHDALTQVFNRAGLMDRLDRLVADETIQPVAILFVDLDGFKDVNDRHGHAVGDQVLQVVAKRIAEAVRADDVVGRLGGDEFVILCPTLTDELARSTARRIEAAVELPIAIEGETITCGASTGVVTSMGGDAGALLEQADAAMYTVKRKRRAARTASAFGHGVPRHPDEARRLDALRRLELLDTSADPVIDGIVRLAAELCGTSMAAVTLIDADRQWLMARVGIEGQETSREDAFCAHTILGDREAMVVDDPLHDARFAQNPYVTGPPNVRFYAGVPISVAGDPPIGSLCVLDDTARRLRPDQIDALERLRDSLVTYLELNDQRRRTGPEGDRRARR